METGKIQRSNYERSLIEASLDPLFTISREGKITDINNASIHVTEVTREKLIGTDFFEYFTEPARARDIYKQVFADGFVADYPLTIRDGKLTEVLFNGSVYKDEKGAIAGVVVVARDVTDHKRIESELTGAKLRAELATKIAEKAQVKAEKAVQIAEEAVKSKQQFLSNMSHEIRTPLNSIIGFTNVLLNTELTPKQREYLQAIKTSGKSLTILINDILDLAKVDAGKMVFEKLPFKLEESISAMLHLFETKIQEKNLQLIRKYDTSIPSVLLGDAVRLHQIILNLVSNAVKFTNTGKITVEAELLSSDKKTATVQFSVSDTGIGIAKDKIEHIFENFQQASDETSRLFGGTGLGLAIAKQLIQMQGGTIFVKSVPGEGSTFSFILTFEKTNEDVKSEINNPETVVELKNIEVLVAEDITLNQLLMQALMDEFGFKYDIADNGKIAVDLLTKKHYDIILMDLQMPEMNGFEATSHIRKILKSKIPIIALTADVTTVDLKKCMEVGMNDYISKPFDEKKLYNKMAKLLTEDSRSLLATSESDQSGKLLSTSKFVDLTYIKTQTRNKPGLIIQMIEIYLEQTPPLISKLKESLCSKDWNLMAAVIHKLIPSFYIVGIHNDFQTMARDIQKYSSRQEHLDELSGLVLQVEGICTQACEELEEELKWLKKGKA
jgi:PAS domain S-box-containing protein